MEQIKRDAYFCATFRNDWSREFNLKLSTELEKYEISSFLPQRDSDQSGNRLRTFREDLNGIDNANCVLAIGVLMQSSNWGFELGYSYAVNKPVLVLTTEEYPLDLMTESSIKNILVVNDINDIPSYIEEIVLFVKTHS